MWRINNRTPYAAKAGFFRDPTGAPHWLIAVRASFELDPEHNLVLATEQAPPLLAPQYARQPHRSSLQYDTDVGPLKPTSEVLVHGSAYAPNGEPTTQVDVALKLGPIHKQLTVFGERHYRPSPEPLATGQAATFTRCSICYENAYGGTDNGQREARNPVGRGFALNPSDRAGTPAHRIEYTASTTQAPQPAGLGPIPSHWQPRIAQAGTFDEQWHKTKRPLLPDDYNPRSTLCAPADQQLPGYLQGGEELQLDNMTPDGQLRITIPRLRIHCTTQLKGRRQAQPSHLTTLIVEPDRTRVALVWQSSLCVPARDLEDIEETLVQATEDAS